MGIMITCRPKKLWIELAFCNCWAQCQWQLRPWQPSALNASIWVMSYARRLPTRSSPVSACLLLFCFRRQRPRAIPLLTRYAQRMLIENALSDAVRFFHIDALSSAVGLKVDFDMAMLVLASGLYRLIAQRMHDYADAQARQIFRDLIDMPADVTVSDA